MCEDAQVPRDRELFIADAFAGKNAIVANGVLPAPLPEPEPIPVPTPIPGGQPPPPIPPPPVADHGRMNERAPMKLIRVFPRKTKATPTDALARFGPPRKLFTEADRADEVHVSVTFTWDKPYAEWLAEQWSSVAPTKIGGVAYGDTSLEFIPGRYIKPGYTITSRGCPRRCWFCSVWKKWPTAHPLPIYDGWNVLDDNLLACPEWHVRAVFDMLKRQTQRVCFTGGLEAAALQDYQVDLLASLHPRPAMFWAYDPGDPFETLADAARRMLGAGFTRESHRLCCYVLIGYPQDTFTKAEQRLTDMLRIGLRPMAMLWKPETASAQKHAPAPEWRAFQRRWVRPEIIYAGQSAETETP